MKISDLTPGHVYETKLPQSPYIVIIDASTTYTKAKDLSRFVPTATKKSYSSGRGVLAIRARNREEAQTIASMKNINFLKHCACSDLRFAGDLVAHALKNKLNTLTYYSVFTRVFILVNPRDVLHHVDDKHVFPTSFPTKTPVVRDKFSEYVAQWKADHQ